MMQEDVGVSRGWAWEAVVTTCPQQRALGVWELSPQGGLLNGFRSSFKMSLKY